jgi:hypothetical protein
MPDFFAVQDAIAWRAVHAPPRGRRSFGKNRVENPPHPQTDQGSTPGNNGGTGHSLPANNAAGWKAGHGGRGGEVIDLKGFIKKTSDFDGLMLEQAQAVPQLAYGLFTLAAKTGDPVEVAAAIKNYADAGRHAAVVREKFLETQEKSRALLSLDEVEDVVGTGLQELRNLLMKQGERVAGGLQAQLPAEMVVLVQQAIDADVDRIFLKLSAVPDRARRELVAS